MAQKFDYGNKGSLQRLVSMIKSKLAKVAFSGKYSDLTGAPPSLPASNTTSDYSATGTAPVNGTAVNKALQTLDVVSKGGAGKYIQAISETDGKISATEATMPTAFPANGGTAQTISDTLPISKGGTGKTTAQSGLEALTAGARTESENYAFSDNDSLLWMYTSSSTAAGNTYKTKFLKLWNYIKGKLATVATTGSYTDLSNKPTIPAVGNGTVTINQAGVKKASFTLNQSGNTTVDLTDNNTTYGNMKGATADAAGTAGLVPGPAAGKQNQFLRGDGTWQTPTNTNNAVTQTATNTANADYRVLFSATADDTTRTEGARKDTDLKYNPSTNTLTTGKVNADVADSTVTFTTGDTTNPTGWADIAAIASGEKISSLMRKCSLGIKNLRYLWKLMGSTGLSGIGDGTVTGAINTLNTGLVTVTLVNYWGSYVNNVIKNNYYCILNLDFIVGKSMSVGETLGDGFPVPKLQTGADILIIPCLVIGKDSVTFSQKAVSVTMDGKLITGNVLGLQDRIIINAVYVI